MALFSEDGKLSLEGGKKSGGNNANLPKRNLLQQAADNNGNSGVPSKSHEISPVNASNDGSSKHSRRTNSVYEARPGTSNGSHLERAHLRSKTVRGKAAQIEQDDSPRKLQRIQSLAKSANYDDTTHNQDQTKRNLSRLLLQEKDQSFQTHPELQDSPDNSTSKSNDKTTVKKSSQARNTIQPLKRINERHKSESEDQSGSNEYQYDNTRNKEDVLSEKTTPIKNKTINSRQNEFGSFDVIDSDESGEVNNTLSEPDSQKGAIASYLFSGLNTQLVPFYVGNENQERIQAQNPHNPENESQLNDVSKSPKEERNRRARSSEPQDGVSNASNKNDNSVDLSHVDVKERRKRLERASSEPPAIEQDFLRRKGPASQKSVTSDSSEISQPAPSKPKFQPEELKSRMADSNTTDSGGQEFYVSQLQEVIIHVLSPL